MAVAWRIVKKKYARTAFSGEGARLFGGRWNYPGTALVYLAESQSLAVLELLVHMDSAELLGHYLTIRVTFDDSLIDSVPFEALPAAWQRDSALKQVRDKGEAWAVAGRTPVLRVPSVVIPTESNYLLNPRHRLFGQIEIGEAIPFQFDERLVRQQGFPDVPAGGAPERRIPVLSIAAKAGDPPSHVGRALARGLFDALQGAAENS
jgi:RES domain-containing protein